MKLAELSPKQHLAITTTQHPEARINIWDGSVRSGKTINSLIAWAGFIAKNDPPGALLMAGRTTDTLRRNVLDPLTEMLGEENVQLTIGDGRAVILNRKVHLVGADNQTAESRIRGLTLAGSYVDELSIIGGPNGEPWFNQLLARHSLPGAKVFATTNPDHPNHWLLKNFLNRATVTIHGDTPTVTHHHRKQHIGVHRYRFTLADNQTLPPDYVASLKASMSGVFARRFIDGEWVAAEGSIFPNLTPTTEPADMLLERLSDFTVGIDVGTTNPTHAVLVGANHRTRTLTVAGEHRVADNTLTFTEQVEQLVRWLNTLEVVTDATIVVDPSARAFRNEWQRRTGSWPWSADNTVLTGISDMGALITRNMLRVSETATPVLVRELAGYRWDTKASLRGEDKPIKQDDHAVDALRYAVQALKTQWKPWVTVEPEHTQMFRPAWMDN